MLARAHLALGDAEAARAVLSPFWRTEQLEAPDEAAIVKEFGKVSHRGGSSLPHGAHALCRTPESAQRVAELAGAKALADAWAAVLRNDKKAGKLLDAVPQRSAPPAISSPRPNICGAPRSSPRQQRSC